LVKDFVRFESEQAKSQEAAAEVIKKKKNLKE
jgi:hypothetical protein